MVLDITLPFLTRIKVHLTTCNRIDFALYDKWRQVRLRDMVR